MGKYKARELKNLSDFVKEKIKIKEITSINRGVMDDYMSKNELENNPKS